MDLPDLYLDSPSQSATAWRASWKPASLDLPSPSCSSPSPSRIRSHRSGSALWQSLRISLMGSVQPVPQYLERAHHDGIYSTDGTEIPEVLDVLDTGPSGPGSDPTSRCSSPISPDALQRRAKGMKGLRLGSTLETRAQREDFLCQQLDDASDEIDRLSMERDDAVKKLHDLAKLLRDHELSQEESRREYVSVACQQSDDGSNSDDNAAQTPHVKRAASCPLNWSPSPEQETTPADSSIFAERRQWHEELLELESFQERLKQAATQAKDEAHTAWTESQSAMERVNVQEVQMDLWRDEVAQAREMQSEEAVMRHRNFILCSAQQDRLRQNVLTTVALKASLLLIGCFTTWRQEVHEHATERTVAEKTELSNAELATATAASTTSSARASATLLSMKMQEMRDTMLTVCCLSAWHTYVLRTERATPPERKLRGSASLASNMPKALPDLVLQTRLLNTSLAELRSARDSARRSWARISSEGGSSPAL